MIRLYMLIEGLQSSKSKGLITFGMNYCMHQTRCRSCVMNRHSSLTSSYHIFLFPDFFSLMTWLNVEFNLIFQIFDRLCQNFGGDVLETLFYSAETLANCSEENRSSCTWKFFYDLALATASSNILLLQCSFLFVACIFYFPNLAP